ncbi:hypothetical protein KsCSTR_00680 [Candidatus Kuenenia stuttgartiensis]|uniref:Uncharacterized protein n=1 Tax=Kuenenia stuttgartiensis TaxID=174633 RepID=A0A6G7GJR1_KUEST|nr:hypothetical protein KsCSTR_00680 [Candidatus Kuenenia stuttgartiensis]
MARENVECAAHLIFLEFAVTVIIVKKYHCIWGICNQEQKPILYI